jgi:hypothetical protein
MLCFNNALAKCAGRSPEWLTIAPGADGIVQFLG